MDSGSPDCTIRALQGLQPVFHEDGFNATAGGFCGSGLLVPQRLLSFLGGIGNPILKARKGFEMSARITSAFSLVLGLLLLPGARSQVPALVETAAKEQQRQVDLYGDPLPPGAIARLGTVRLRHIVRDGSGAAGIAFSPDGKTLVSCVDVGVRVWDVASGKRLADPFSNEDKKLMNQLFQRQKQEGFASASALSPDGKIRG